MISGHVSLKSGHAHVRLRHVILKSGNVRIMFGNETLMSGHISVVGARDFDVRACDCNIGTHAPEVEER